MGVFVVQQAGRRRLAAALRIIGLAGLGAVAGAAVGFAVADRGVRWFPTTFDALIIGAGLSLIMLLGGQIMADVSLDAGRSRIRIRKRSIVLLVLVVVVGLVHLTSCRMQQSSPLTQLSPTEFAEAFQADLDVHERLDAGLAEQLAVLEAHPAMFDGAHARPPTDAEARLLRDVWVSIYDQAFALDRIRLFYEDWYKFDPSRAQRAYHVRSFLLTFAAELSLYEKAIRICRLVARNPNVVAFLDAPHPGTDLGPETFSTFRRQLTGSADAVRVGAGRAYLKIVENTLDGRRIAVESGCEALWDKSETQIRLLDAIAPAEWAAATVQGDIEPLRRGVLRVWYPSVQKVATWMGDTRLRRRVGEVLVTDEQLEEMDRLLEPGDILLTRKNWYMSNIGLPGFWPHAVLYVGGPEKLADYFDDDAVRAWLQERTGRGTTFVEYLSQMYPQRWLEYSLAIDGRPHRVIESVKDGVVMHTLSQCAGDSIAVLRPRKDKLAKAQAIVEVFRHVGKPYDYQFDFATDHALVCTELVWRSWRPGPGKEGLDLPLVEIAGRWTLPANEIARLYAETADEPDRLLDFVCFLDAREQEGRSMIADEPAFRRSHNRPKWASP